MIERVTGWVFFFSREDPLDSLIHVLLQTALTSAFAQYLRSFVVG